MYGKYDGIELEKINRETRKKIVAKETKLRLKYQK